MIEKVFDAVSAKGSFLGLFKRGASKRAALKKAFGLQKDHWATAAQLQAEFGEWLKPEKDLQELLDALSALEGVYPQSETGFRWDHNEEQLKSLAAEVVARSQRVFDGIAHLKPGEHTFLNTLEALNANDRIVQVWSTNVSFIRHVSASQAIRDVATEWTKTIREFDVQQTMSMCMKRSRLLVRLRRHGRCKVSTSGSWSTHCEISSATASTCLRTSAFELPRSEPS